MGDAMRFLGVMTVLGLVGLSAAEFVNNGAFDALFGQITASQAIGAAVLLLILFFVVWATQPADHRTRRPQ